MSDNKIVSYYLDIETIETISKLSQTENRTKSAIIKRAIKCYMERDSE